MANGELKLDAPVRLDRNPINGRFLKGRRSENKGRKWDEWMSKEAQKRSARGWSNLDKYRPVQRRPAMAGRRARAVIAVTDKGAWRYFKSIAEAGRQLGIRSHSIKRCCHCNCEPSKTWKIINTDHRYKGYRFYFESDPTWQDKINK